MNQIVELARRHQEILALLTLVSAAGFVFGILAVSRLVCWLPADYFTVIDAPGKAVRPLCRPAGIIKNLIGLVLVFSGVVMLLVPGQGLLTLFLGFLFMDFPGKKVVILYFIRMNRVQASLNWIRKRNGRPQFIFPDRGQDE